MKIIKCRFLKDYVPFGREYTYFSNVEVAVGDLVEVETKQGKTTVLVTQIDVPEKEIEGFKEKVKTIIGKIEVGDGAK